MILTLSDDEADLVLMALQTVIMDADDEISDLAHTLERRIIDLTPQPQQGPIAEPVSSDSRTFANVLTRAIQSETVVEITYSDRKGTATKRRICPILADHSEAPDIVTAYCELRRDFRHFRLEHIRSIRLTGTSYSRRLRLLRAEYLSTADQDDLW